MKASSYDSHCVIEHGRNRFSVYMDDVPTDQFTFLPPRFQMSELHPYDDADYAWAKFDGGNVKFYRSGKLIDQMAIHEYEEDDYEDYDEYVSDILDSVAVTLRELNTDVKPRISPW